MVLGRVLSTVRMNSPSLVSSVWRTRTSGISRGIEINGYVAIRIILHAVANQTVFCPISTRTATLHVGAFPASPGEPETEREEDAFGFEIAELEDERDLGGDRTEQLKGLFFGLGEGKEELTIIGGETGSPVEGVNLRIIQDPQ